MDKENRCSFCCKSPKEVVCIVAGPGDVNICNECVGISEGVVLSVEGTAEFKASLTDGEKNRIGAAQEIKRTNAYIQHLEREGIRDDKRIKAMSDHDKDWHEHARHTDLCHSIQTGAWLVIMVMIIIMVGSHIS